MSYAEDSLIPGEEVKYQAHLTLAPLIMQVVGMIVCMVIAVQIHMLLVLLVMLIFLGVCVRYLIDYWTTEFVVTNQRVIGKTGLIRVKSMEIFLHKVESITVRQGIPERLFNYGTIIVTGTGGSWERFPLITKPLALRKRINAQIAAMRKSGAA